MSNTSTTVPALVNTSDPIKYLILQICYIPSLICSLFTLIRLLMNRNIRSALHNHIPLVLVIICTFDAFLNHPFTLYQLSTGRVMFSFNGFCLAWNFLNSMFTVTTFLTMAWGSIERQLLIFHSSLFSTKRKRLLFHYIPLVIITLIYPLISHLIIFVFYPCTNQFNLSSSFCGYTCALKVPTVAIYARIVHNFIPTSIVVSFSMILFIRVIIQKRSMNRNQFNWRRYHRMMTQILTLACLFLFLTLPATIVSIIQSCCRPTFGSNVQGPYLNFLVRFLTICMPFVCLSLLPEIWPRFRCRHRQNTRVVPFHTATHFLLRTR